MLQFDIRISNYKVRDEESWGQMIWGVQTVSLVFKPV